MKKLQDRRCARCTVKSRYTAASRAEENGGVEEAWSEQEEEDEQQGGEAARNPGWPALSAAEADSAEENDDGSGERQLRARARRQFSNRVKEECWRRAEEVPGRHADS